MDTNSAVNPDYAKPDHDVTITSSNEGRLVRIAATEGRRGFVFKVSRGVVEVTAGPPPEHPGPMDSGDWRKALTPYEKVNVMHTILSRYRTRSQDPDVHVASVAVTTTGNLYIAVNGHIVPRQGAKQCSEQKSTSFGAEQETDRAMEMGFEPQPFELEEIYIEGGREPDMHMMGPCGDCIDMLSKVMQPESKVWCLPSGYGSKLIDIQDTAQNIDEAPRNMAWATTIGYLNRNRRIDVGEASATIMNDGLAQVKRDVRNWLVPVQEDPNVTIRPDSEWLDRLPDTVRQRAGREVPPDKLNDYMLNQIRLTLANRLEAYARRSGRGSLTNLDDAQVEHFLKEEIAWVRCAVVQRDDGKLFASVTTRVPDEKSTEIAETNAMGQGMRKAGTDRFQKVWCMEFNPKTIGEGQMRTSAKSAVERLMKWRSLRTDTVDFYYLPFNAGGLSASEVGDHMVHKDAYALYPTAHFGVPSHHVTTELDSAREAGLNFTTRDNILNRGTHGFGPAK